MNDHDRLVYKSECFLKEESILNDDSGIIFESLDYAYFSTGRKYEFLRSFVYDVYESDLLLKCEKRIDKMRQQKVVSNVYLIGLLTIVEREYYNGILKAFKYVIKDFDGNRYYRILKIVFKILNIEIRGNGKKFENYFLNTLGYDRRFVSNIINNFPTFWRYYSVEDNEIEFFLKSVEQNYIDKLILSSDYDELIYISNVLEEHPRKTISILHSLIDYIHLYHAMDKSEILMNENYVKYLKKNKIMSRFLNNENFNYSLNKFKKLIMNMPSNTEIVTPHNDTVRAKDYNNILLGTHFINKTKFEVVLNKDLTNARIAGFKKNEINIISDKKILYVSIEPITITHPYKYVDNLKLIYKGKEMYVCYISYPIGYSISIDEHTIYPKDEIFFTPSVTIVWNPEKKKYTQILKVSTLRIYNQSYKHKMVRILVNGLDTDKHYYFNDNGFIGREDIYLSKEYYTFADNLVTVSLMIDNQAIIEKELKLRNEYMFDTYLKEHIDAHKYMIGKGSKVVIFSRRKIYELNRAYIDYSEDDNYYQYKFSPHEFNSVHLDNRKIVFEVNNNYINFNKTEFVLGEYISCSYCIDSIPIDDLVFVLENNDNRISNNLSKYLRNNTISVSSIFDDLETKLLCGQWFLSVFAEGRRILSDKFRILPLVDFIADKNCYYNGNDIKGKLKINYGENIKVLQNYGIGKASLKDDFTTDKIFNIFLEDTEKSIELKVDYSTFYIAFYSTKEQRIIYEDDLVLYMDNINDYCVCVITSTDIFINTEVNHKEHILACKTGFNTFDLESNIVELREINTLKLIDFEKNKRLRVVVQTKINDPEIVQNGSMIKANFCIVGIRNDDYIAKLLYNNKVVEKKVFSSSGYANLEFELEYYEGGESVTAFIEKLSENTVKKYTSIVLSKEGKNIRDIIEWLYEAYNMDLKATVIDENKLVSAVERFINKEILIQ